MSGFRKRAVVTDDFGNLYAIDRVNPDGTVDLHSVITKEAWSNVPVADLTVVDGLVEA